MIGDATHCVVHIVYSKDTTSYNQIDPLAISHLASHNVELVASTYQRLFVIQFRLLE